MSLYKYLSAIKGLFKVLLETTALDEVFKYFLLSTKIAQTLHDFALVQSQ